MPDRRLRGFERYLRYYEKELKELVRLLEKPPDMPFFLWFVKYHMEQVRFAREMLEPKARFKERRERIEELERKYLPLVLEKLDELGDDRTLAFFQLTMGRFLRYG